MRVVVDGADLGSVVEALRAITGQEVAFVGPDAACAGGWLEALIAEDGDGTAIGEKAVLLGPNGAGRQAIAVEHGVGRSARWGRLAVATGTPAATRDVVATEQAAVACALLLSRQDAAAGAMRRLESEFVGDLIDGRILDEAEAIVRSRQLTGSSPRPRGWCWSRGPVRRAAGGRRPRPSGSRRSGPGSSGVVVVCSPSMACTRSSAGGATPSS